MLLFLLIVLCSCKSTDYNKAVEVYKSGDYEQAITSFKALEDYKDSASYLEDSYYNLGVKQSESGEYKKAVETLMNVPNKAETKDQFKRLLTKLLEGDFFKHYNAAVTAYTDYYDLESKKMNDAYNAILSGAGSISIEFTTDSPELAKMESESSAMMSSFSAIKSIFSKDVLDVCDADTKQAYEAASELRLYAGSLFTKANAINSFASDFSGGSTPYTTKGLSGKYLAFKDALKKLDPSYFSGSSSSNSTSGNMSSSSSTSTAISKGPWHSSNVKNDGDILPESIWIMV